jgi:hypothetical protein
VTNIFLIGKFGLTSAFMIGKILLKNRNQENGQTESEQIRPSTSGVINNGGTGTVSGDTIALLVNAGKAAAGCTYIGVKIAIVSTGLVGASCFSLVKAGIVNAYKWTVPFFKHKDSTTTINQEQVVDESENSTNDNPQGE